MYIQSGCIFKKKKKKTFIPEDINIRVFPVIFFLYRRYKTPGFSPIKKIDSSRRFHDHVM